MPNPPPTNDHESLTFWRTERCNGEAYCCKRRRFLAFPDTGRGRSEPLPCYSWNCRTCGPRRADDILRELDPLLEAAEAIFASEAVPWPYVHERYGPPLIDPTMSREEAQAERKRAMEQIEKRFRRDPGILWKLLVQHAERAYWFSDGDLAGRSHPRKAMRPMTAGPPQEARDKLRDALFPPDRVWTAQLKIKAQHEKEDDGPRAFACKFSSWKSEQLALDYAWHALTGEDRTPGMQDCPPGADFSEWTAKIEEWVATDDQG